jgi:hypothetical protein
VNTYCPQPIETDAVQSRHELSERRFEQALQVDLGLVVRKCHAPESARQLRGSVNRNLHCGNWFHRSGWSYDKRFIRGSRNARHQVAVAFGFLKVHVAMVDLAGNETQFAGAACAAFAR